MQEKLLTVSIAAYNVESYLRETVASLLRQKDLIELLDILIVNDGSTDHSRERIESFIQDIPEAVEDTSAEPSMEDIMDYISATPGELAPDDLIEEGDTNQDL